MFFFLFFFFRVAYNFYLTARVCFCPCPVFVLSFPLLHLDAISIIDHELLNREWLLIQRCRHLYLAPHGLWAGCARTPHEHDIKLQLQYAAPCILAMLINNCNNIINFFSREHIDIFFLKVSFFLIIYIFIITKISLGYKHITTLLMAHPFFFEKKDT